MRKENQRVPLALGPIRLGALLGVVAFAFFAWGLGDAGFWSDAELPVLDRARAALGAALSGLEHGPELPQWLRTQSYALVSNEFGIRLPHAIAAACLVGIATAWARALGASPLVAGTAGLLALSFPLMGLGGRTLLVNPIGELCSVAAVGAGVLALRAQTMRFSVVFAVLCTMAWVASVASAGLVVGGAIPLLALALFGDSTADEHHPYLGKSTVLRVGLVVAAVTVVATGVVLVVGQQDGYIPLLGAAKDVGLIDRPQARRFAEVLADFGYQIFPWVGLVLVGATVRTMRWPALWCVAGICVVGGWSLLYGSTPLPLTVPAALCGSAAVQTFTDPERSGAGRRLAVFVIAAGALVLRKDASLNPGELVAPTVSFGGEHNFPAEELSAEARLGDMAKFAFFGVVVAGLLGRRREQGWLERISGRIPSQFRDVLIVGGFGAAAAGSAFTHTHGLVSATGVALSPRRALERHAEWSAAGFLPSVLGVHRIRDPGLALYATEQLEKLGSRREVTTLLSSDAPAVALVRTTDVPTLFQHARANGWPFFVLDDSNARMRVVANRLPDDATDLNPLHSIVFDEPPPLANETFVKFENLVEIIGWEVDGPIRRGAPQTLQVAFRVLRPLPAGAKLYARFTKGRLGLINPNPEPLTGGAYPCNLWREGDFVLHTFEFVAPPLEIPWGEYDLVVGLRRTEKKNFSITLPEGKTGEFGVQIKDRKREFAMIGKVQVR